MHLFENCYAELAAAYVRGMAMQARDNRMPLSSEEKDLLLSIPDEWVTKPLKALTQEEIESLLSAGHRTGLKLYRFKNTHDMLPRVKRVIGFLRGIPMESLMDVGSGRGVFLWPFLNEFQNVKVLSVDLLAHRVAFIQTVALGGVSHLSAVQDNICTMERPEKAFDVVTLLEVLEHIPDPAAALSTALRMAKSYVVLSVPSKPDNNPEHIHLFTKASLAELFVGLGCDSLHFDAVPGHMLVVASLKP